MWYGANETLGRLSCRISAKQSAVPAEMQSRSANGGALHYSLNNLLFPSSLSCFNDYLQAVECNLNFLIYWTIKRESKCYWFIS